MNLSVEVRGTTSLGVSILIPMQKEALQESQNFNHIIDNNRKYLPGMNKFSLARNDLKNSKRITTIIRRGTLSYWHRVLSWGG